jgi:N-acyl-D-aspartate/D-glutamate deacylase
MNDLVIKNALVVDGTGTVPAHTDVGITGRLVSEIGPRLSGRRELDAEGMTLIPGFVDLHTHYDAQVWWDPLLTPALAHGVTTVISGNCGLTLAPIRPEDQDFGVRLLANVEGIPPAAIASGVPFSWRTFPEMLDHLDRQPLGVNLGLMVGHSAIRRHVLGEAASSRPADGDELDQMSHILDEALNAGGFGFSTATAPTHRDGAGRPTPPNFASPEEFVELSRVCGRHRGTSLEFIARTSQEGFDDADRGLMAAMSAAASRVLNWNTPVVTKDDPTLHVRQLEGGRIDPGAGICVVPMMMSQNYPLYYDLHRGYVHRTLPGWGWLFDLDIEHRVMALRAPAVRERLRRSLQEQVVGSTALRLRRWEYYEVVEVGPPDLQSLRGRTIGSIASEQGKDPFETWVDLLVETSFDIGYAIAYYPGEDPWVTANRKAMLTDPRVMVGASDGGAHMDMLVGGSSALRTLIEWVYERQEFPLEEMVRLLTDVPARLYGLRSRGRIAQGYEADLVLFDPSALGVGRMRVVHDLPESAPRLISEPSGVACVMVGGTAVYMDNLPTGEHPGRLLRSGRDSVTVTPSDWINRELAVAGAAAFTGL